MAGVEGKGPSRPLAWTSEASSSGAVPTPPLRMWWVWSGDSPLLDLPSVDDFGD